MRLTVLGGGGGWPAAGLACSGYLVAPGDGLEVGPFGVRSWLLPHWMPNAGLRLEADGQVLAYTGDSGPSPLLAELARGADIFLAEATEPWEVTGG